MPNAPFSQSLSHICVCVLCRFSLLIYVISHLSKLLRVVIYLHANKPYLLSCRFHLNFSYFMGFNAFFIS